MAQPSLSQQIRRLEGDLGVTLFDRLGRTVRLTKYGRELLPRADEILREVKEARVCMEGLDCETRGRLVVGATGGGDRCGGAGFAGDESGYRL